MESDEQPPPADTTVEPTLSSTSTPSWAKNIDEKAFICFVCHATLWNRQKWESHLFDHYATNIYECEDCQKTTTTKSDSKERSSIDRRYFTDREKYARHLHIKHQTLCCLFCEAKFRGARRRELLDHHVETICSDEADVVTCELCQLEFKPSFYNRHLGRHHEVFRALDKVPSVRRLRSDWLIPEGLSDMVDCVICGLQFINNFLLKVHHKQDHVSEHKEFLRSPKLMALVEERRNAMRKAVMQEEPEEEEEEEGEEEEVEEATQTEEDDTIQCGGADAAKGDEGAGGDEKAGGDKGAGGDTIAEEIKCQYCHKEFSRWWDLKRHQAVMRESCKICSTIICELQLFPKHVEDEHANLPFIPCILCDAVVPRDYLRNHRLRCQGYKHRIRFEFGCNDCGFESTAYTGMKWHVCPTDKDKKKKEAKENLHQVGEAQKTYGGKRRVGCSLAPPEKRSRDEIINHATEANSLCWPGGSSSTREVPSLGEENTTTATQGNDDVAARPVDICDICDATFSLRIQLKNHLLGPRYPCKLCAEWHCSLEDLFDHLSEKHSEDNYIGFPCPDCDEVSISLQELRMKHMEKVHREITCRACTQMFEKKRNFTIHMRKEHPHYDYESEELRVRIRKKVWDSCENISVLNGGKTYDGKMKRNHSNHSIYHLYDVKEDTVAAPACRVTSNSYPSQEYVLAVVTKAGKTNAAVKRGLEDSSSSGTIAALTNSDKVEENKESSQSDNLFSSLNGENTSISTKCFFCDLCSQRLETKRGWEMHVRTHYMPLEYTCEVCHNLRPRVKTKFDVRSDYLNHLNSHGLYRCTFCDGNFVDKIPFRDHILSHLKQKDLKKCYLCDLVSVPNVHERHIKQHMIKPGTVNLRAVKNFDRLAKEFSIQRWPVTSAEPISVAPCVKDEVLTDSQLMVETKFEVVKSELE